MINGTSHTGEVRLKAGTAPVSLQDFNKKTFNLRVLPELHAEIAARAAAEGKSLNKYVTDLLENVVHSQ